MKIGKIDEQKVVQVQLDSVVEQLTPEKLTQELQEKLEARERQAVELMAQLDVLQKKLSTVPSDNELEIRLSRSISTFRGTKDRQVIVSFPGAQYSYAVSETGIARLMVKNQATKTLSPRLLRVLECAMGCKIADFATAWNGAGLPKAAYDANNNPLPEYSDIAIKHVETREEKIARLQAELEAEQAKQ